MKQAWRNAADRGVAHALRAMLESGGQDVDACDRYGQTALMLVARSGHVDAARVLIIAQADLDHAAKYGLSALMLAIINGHDEAARLLIEAGADITMTGTGCRVVPTKPRLTSPTKAGRGRPQWPNAWVPHGGAIR